MTSPPTIPVYGKRIVCNVRVKMAAVMVIALASGVMLVALSHEPESRCSLVWMCSGK